MRLLLALLLGLTVSGQAVTLATNTYSLHFDDLCNTENSGADASANADTWIPVGSVIYGSANPAPAEGSYYLTTTSASVHLTMSAAVQTALASATSWSWEFYLFKFGRQANSYVWSFNDAGLFLFQCGAGDDVLRLRCNGIETTYNPGDIRGAWHHIFVEGNTTAPYQRIYLDGVGVTGTATAGSGEIGASTVARFGSFHSGSGAGVLGGIDQVRICIPACTPPGPTVDPVASAENRSMWLKRGMRMKQ